MSRHEARSLQPQGDDRVFWLIAGEEAKLGEAGGPVQWCRNDPRAAVWELAKLNGADWQRATNRDGTWRLGPGDAWC